MRNNNCLYGLKCPKCGSLEPLHIGGSAIFEVWDCGSDNFTGLEWEDDSSCCCGACDHDGKVADFKVLRKKRKTPLTFEGKP